MTLARCVDADMFMNDLLNQNDRNMEKILLNITDMDIPMPTTDSELLNTCISEMLRTQLTGKRDGKFIGRPSASDLLNKITTEYSEYPEVQKYLVKY